MANERSGDSITQYLASVFLFAGTWIATNHIIDVLEIELGLYTWFFATLLVAFLVSIGVFILYFRLKSSVRTKLALLQ